MSETPEETMERLRTQGYLAHCHAHGNQTFVYEPVNGHVVCPMPLCIGEVCDFRLCTQDGVGHCNQSGMIFWHARPWVATSEERAAPAATL